MTLSKLDLPEEILENIISRCCRNTLLSLSIAAKKLNRIATPHLYGKVAIIQGRDGSSEALIPLAHLCFTSPTHASLIKYIFIKGHDEGGPYLDEGAEFHILEWSKWGQPELFEVLKQKCAAYIGDDERADEVFGMLESGNQDALLAVFLASLPNLSRLNVDMTAVGEMDFVNVLLLITGRINSGHADCWDTRPFINPISIHLDGGSWKYPRADLVGQFFSLPNLHSFSAWQVGDEEEDAISDEESVLERLMPRRCPVQSIEFRDSNFDSFNLQLLMRATIPGKLKTFIYELGHDGLSCPVNHSGIMKSLEAHQATLEFLSLSHCTWPAPWEYRSRSNDASSISFTTFKALTHLKISPVFIWDYRALSQENPGAPSTLWKALPTNLEELWIICTEQKRMLSKRVKFVSKTFIPALELVAQQKPHAFPKLQSLKIQFQRSHWLPDWLESLAWAFRKAEKNGIHCTIIMENRAPIADEPEPEPIPQDWGWYEDDKWDSHTGSVWPPMYIKCAEEEDLITTLKHCREGKVSVFAQKACEWAKSVGIEHEDKGSDASDYESDVGYSDSDDFYWI